MNTRVPRVSIGMPIYNEEKYLRESLDSLLAQDYADFELIISDNASVDATQQICLEYVARDSRIRYLRCETNLGAAENFNRVFRASSGEYFMWAGGHDVWAPTYLSRCLEVLESDATIVQCNSVAQYMSQDGKEFGRTVHQIDTRRHGLFVRANLALWQPSAFLAYSLLRSSALRQTRLMSRVLGPDLLVGFELSLLGPTAIVPEPLFFMRDNRGESSRPITRAQAMAGFHDRLYPRGTTPVGRFGWVKYLVEEMRAVMRAPLSWGQRIVLMGSIPPTYFIFFNFRPYLPQGIRSTFRRLLTSYLNSPHN
ncbi:MAG: glycosyltransferase [Acidobacteriia bacterium]|nr:glycosyltransferase [Terriglobia bacterium]